MPGRDRRRRSVLRHVFLLFVCPALFCATSVIAGAQTPDGIDARRRGFELYEQNKFVDAIPFLERALSANPNDPVILERLAFSMMASATGVPDLAQRTQVRLRARQLALKAQELGDNSSLLHVILDSIPENGEISEKFSDQQEVDSAMREGEAAFARGDFDKAVAAYARALELNPKQYEAALFTGDVYYKQNKLDQAGVWFARAIEIDGNRETAYRYWGDALMRGGKAREARDKFVEAIIAEPYSRYSWNGLAQWGQVNRVPLGHPKVDIPQSSVQPQGERNVTILINPNDLEKGAVWLVYAGTRSLWIMSKFGETFPNEKVYRHSLPEETEALRLAAESIGRGLEEGTLKEDKLDPSMANLRMLHRADLLEPFILFAKPDAGIAQDYAGYRDQHRDRLRQYLNEYVIAAAGPR